MAQELRWWWGAIGALLGAVAAGPAGCAGGGSAPAAAPQAGDSIPAGTARPALEEGLPDTSLAALMAAAEGADDALASAAAAVERRLRSPRAGDPAPDPEPTPAPGAGDALVEADPAPAPSPDGQASAVEGSAQASPAAAVPNPLPGPLTLEAHLRAAAELAAGHAQADPLRSAVLLAALHAARPDLFPAAPDLPALTPEQADAARGIRVLVERLLASGGDGGSDPAAIVQELAGELAAARGLRITDAALCLRVRAFGSYDPLPSPRLLAGRAHRLIVYAAVDGFAHRPARGTEAAGLPGASWAVELAEEVSVFHDSPESMLALHRPEQSVVEVSRARRRDFFLVQEITLPRTLAAGPYIVKVTVRDRTSGAQDERTIPLQIVAEPAMLTRGG